MDGIATLQIDESEDSSPVTGSGELIYQYGQPETVHDEFSDLADSMPSVSKYHRVELHDDEEDIVDGRATQQRYQQRMPPLA